MRTLADALHPSRRRLLMLAMVEFLVLMGALYLAAQLRFQGSVSLIRVEIGAVFPRAFIFAAVITLSMAALGLYQSQWRGGLRAQLARAALAFVFGGVVLMAAYYALPGSYIGRGVLLLALALGIALVTIVRLASLRLLSADLLKRRVLIVGAGRKAAEIDQRLRRSADRKHFAIVGFLPMPGDEVHVPANYRLAEGRSISELAEELGVDEIVVGPDNQRGTLPMAELLQCRVRGITVVDLPTFFERETGKVKVNLLNPSWLVFGDGFDQGLWRGATKRLFDVCVSVGMLLATAPIMLITVILIKWESRWRGPVLYRQERVGEHGACFNVWKFRSMRTDAEKDGVARWATSNDDRVTRVGRVIRKTRIDELPQILNVLRGEMSFVGPRPERPTFVDELTRQIPYYGLRHCVKPGLTGWAQLRYPYGASVDDAQEKLKYDLYYVKNHSLLFDALILLQTVEVVVFGKGAR